MITRYTKKSLTPLNDSFRFKSFIGFDIETVGKKNEFYMGSLYHPNFYDVCYCKEDMVKAMVKRSKELPSCLITATNLSFDLLGTVNETEYLKDLYPIFRGGRMISASLFSGRKTIKFIDTLNFLNMSVEKIGDKILHLPKLEKPSFLGQYPKTTDQETYLRKYNKRDSEISQKIMCVLQKYYAELKTCMKLTASSTSMDCFRRNFLEYPVKSINVKYLRIHKKGYYGGRTETFKRGLVTNEHKKFYGYDINSLYPYVMKKNYYPDPNSIKHTLGGSKRLIRDYEGISDCIVSKHTNDCIPYLPFRCDNGRLIFPLGEFRGVYSHFELRKAETLGYEIKKIFETNYYTKTMKPFDKFVTTFYELRKKFKLSGNEAMQILCKLNMNSLYGKFFQDPYNERTVRHIDSLTMDDINDFINEGFQESIAGKDGEWRYYDRKVITPDCIPSFVIPIWAVYTTAFARDTLYKYLNSDTVYCDTDSVFTTQKLKTSNELGDMKLEYDIKKAVFIRPKFYIVETTDGDTYIRVKGIRGLTPDSFMKAIKNGNKARFSYTKFATFTQCNRLYRQKFLSYNEIMEIEKIYSTNDEKRNWNNKDFSPEELQVSDPIVI